LRRDERFEAAWCLSCKPSGGGSVLKKEVAGFVLKAGELAGAEGCDWLLEISWSRDSSELTLLRELMKNFLLRTSLVDESAVDARARPVAAKMEVVNAVAEEEEAEVAEAEEEAWKP